MADADPDATERLHADWEARNVPERFRHLPPPVLPDEMVEVKDTEPPLDPEFGRDPERDFMLRNWG